MKSYYQDKNLPEPTVPAVQALTLLKGQTALVTGGNSGIGRAIAISLGRAGANVVVNYVVNLRKPRRWPRKSAGPDSAP